ncbi:hypothetical protein [Olsenella urininfantis]|uniref:hypothetical protein n=1 Tax=Olsenella urininfantis TaxID=1871033 RepID=UPI000986F7AC|nr:hypothetical protein [Olsenella urininfantis]
MSATLPPVLDACCGGESFYFARGHVLTVDAHPRSATLCDGRVFRCEPDLARGFAECWRVLAPLGTLVFKWSDVQLPLSDVRRAFPAEPLYGNRRPRSSKTHWVVFVKEES